MRKSKFASIISYGVVMALFLTGCGETPAKAPKLIEPVANNESYRPVTMGDIGNVNTGRGVVVPTEYCHFWDTSVIVDEVMVTYGEFVEAGQVIATVDTEMAENGIRSLRESIAVKESKWSIAEEIYQYDLSELTYKYQGYVEMGMVTEAEAIASQIAILKENHNYDTLMHEYEINSLNEEIGKYQKILDEGTLVAKHSGYVTYIKDLSDSDMVSYGENVIIISDYEDTYISLVETPVEAREIDIYTSYHTYVNGEKEELEFYDYLPEEMMIAQNKGLYPTLRMKFLDESKSPEIGNNIIIYFYTEYKENVLLVGNDSLYQDEQGTYVNVKSENGVEQRYIEVGQKDNYYTEVVSGLSEGELIAYSSEAVVPKEYDELTVELQDYKMIYFMESNRILDTTSKKYYSDYEGTISSVAVADGDMVEKGDLICVIETNEGSAMLAQMRNDITNFKETHKMAMTDVDSQIAALEAEIAMAYEKQNQPVDELATDTDSLKVQEPYLYEQLQCQLEKAKLTKQMTECDYTYQLQIMEENYAEISANNDGAGGISIYAQQAGVITSANMREGKNVSYGDRLYNIKTPSEKYVQIRSEEIVKVNQKIVFSEPSTDKSYEGTVVAIGGDEGGFYFSEVDGRVVITNNGMPNTFYSYLVKLDDESYYEAEGDFKAYGNNGSFDSVVVLREGQVYSETMLETQRYYVWKVCDGELYKQYVQVVPTPGKKEVCVVTGLTGGDVIAVEKQVEEKE
ncbi:MAG: efflux RND transporter periplasmic adaptor subunit [Lachnospiraceae bacterium]|nr:efflux RND transporter periplasmic adaptor subunit [Lachnospiraceae bacterium]